MPDQYGRPTFNDGISLAAGFRAINQDRTKQNVSKIAQQIAENPDWKPGKGESYTDDELWQGRIMGISAYMDKLNLENAQMQQKALVYRLEQEEFMGKWNKEIEPLLQTSPDEGIAAAYNLFNGSLKNGITVQATEGNKITITTLDGKTTTHQAPTVEQVRQMAQGFMDPKAALAARISWDQNIKKTNMEQMLKAQDLRDPETGKALGVKAANLFDKATNSLRPVYIDIKTGNELSADEVKALAKNGFITAEEMKNTLDLQAKSFDAQTAQAKLIKEIQGGNVKTEDLKRLQNMIQDAGNNPDKTQVALIKKAANKLGMDFKETEKVGFWGTKSSTYELVDLPTSENKSSTGQGLAGADSILETKRKKGKSIPSRKPGENIEDYVARTQAKG